MQHLCHASQERLGAEGGGLDLTKSVGPRGINIRVTMRVSREGVRDPRWQSDRVSKNKSARSAPLLLPGHTVYSYHHLECHFLSRASAGERSATNNFSCNFNNYKLLPAVST